MKITIRADEGKWLTNGEIYGKTISLAVDVSVNDFYEITEEEYNKIQEESSNIGGGDNNHEVM